jgi:hypothetical protein
MHWFLVRDKACWWLTAGASGFAERISQPKVTGQQVEQCVVIDKETQNDDCDKIEKNYFSKLIRTF